MRFVKSSTQSAESILILIFTWILSGLSATRKFEASQSALRKTDMSMRE